MVWNENGNWGSYSPGNYYNGILASEATCDGAYINPFGVSPSLANNPQTGDLPPVPNSILLPNGGNPLPPPGTGPCEDGWDTDGGGEGTSITKAMWVTAYGPPGFPEGEAQTSSGSWVGPGSIASWRIPSSDIPEVTSTATGSGSTYYPYGAVVTIYDANGNVIYTGTIQDKGPDVPGGQNIKSLLSNGVRPESWLDVWSAKPRSWATGWYGVNIRWGY